jgi:hypothetical protein
MKTIFELPTLGDSMTQPGGVALRATDDGSEFIVHNYNTDRETGTERHYFQGSYYSAGSPQNRFMNALTEFTRRGERQSGYDTGGAIDMGKLLGFPSIPGFVDASGAHDMAEALR